MDANPANVILDILTGSVWKLGLPSSDIDTASFTAAANVLANEANGYSAIHNSKSDAAAVITDILRQINGVLFQSALTGLIKLRLIRASDTPYAMTITADNIIDKPEYNTSAWAETFNQVRVLYSDRDNAYQQGSVIAQNLSVMGMQGGRIRTFEVTFAGVKQASLATKLAARELAACSRPIAKIACTLSRAFYAIEPGDVVPVTIPKYGLSAKMMRVVSMDLGELAVRGIRVTLIEDVFNGVGQYGTVAPPTTNTRVEPLNKRVFVEAPRYMAQQMSNVTGIAFDSDAPRVMALATPDDNADGYYEQTYTPLTAVQAINALGNYYRPDVPKHAFPISFTLVNNYSRIYEPYDTTTGLLVLTNLVNVPATLTPFESIVNIDAQGNPGMLLLLVAANGQQEIVSFETVTNLGGSPTQYRLNNVWRALLDTVPLDHIVGERGYALDAASVGRLSFNLGQTVHGQAVPSRGGVT